MSAAPRRRIYRAAIVGCGAIAGGYDETSGFKAVFTHAGAYSRHPRTKIISAADVDARRLGEFRRTWKIPSGYRTARELLRREPPDILSICTPDLDHAAAIREALSAPRPPSAIFCEKPVTGDPREAARLVHECARRGVSLWVNYQRRWDSLHQSVRRDIMAGKFGKVQAAAGYYVRGTFHNGCTLFNTMRFLLGRRVLSASAAVDSAGRASVGGTLLLEGGLQAHIIGCDSAGYRFHIFEIDIIGEKGRVRLFDNGYQVQKFIIRDYPRYKGFKELTPVPSAWPASGLKTCMLTAVGDMVRALDSGKVTVQSGAESVEDLLVAGALCDSARLCRAVAVPNLFSGTRGRR